MIKDDEYLTLMQAINRVMEWVRSLLDETSMPLKNPSERAQRVFSSEECECLSIESRHYLLTLVLQGVLTPVLCERIIHHAMLLELQGIDLPVIEGITRILLDQQPEMAHALAHIDKLMSGGNHSIH